MFFPMVCEACNNVLADNELVICTKCRHDLPVTNFHLENSETVKKVVYGRVKLEQATALLYFSKKGVVQQLLHNLKYRGHKDISGFLGKWLGAELKTIEAYKQVDVVVPVPLYKVKLRQRGYNQVEQFGKAIAEALSVDYNDSVLIKTKSTKTKVFEGRLTRWSDEGAVFAISDYSTLKGKHILLVDDIITTGATVEACATELLKIDNIKLSLATMAIAN
ncbi:phosphoribosyltransferase family protein [Winogradskyella sp. YYF002]|uniref:Phosphoribosyltransferase family protein n=1 Tax=Winogradskyella marincola TaxID=3037795 RepID=A0ABT6G2D2_9FLAO|nr:phosphoribosyltransferase family protein [Winogradskyella sp. YYF002]MDG4716009.1 phosphoribosyltransferase family protein [Winogradskyella sp. YYF002]